MEQISFPIYNFSQVIHYLKAGDEAERGNLRLTLEDDVIMMRIDGEVIAPWLPTHKDILATDWRVIKIG